MEDILNKFKACAAKYRMKEGSIWFDQINIQFLKSLSNYERDDANDFFNFLEENKYLTRNNDDQLILTKECEILIYGTQNNPKAKILNELSRLELKENYHWQFANHNMFYNKLNPVEQQNFSSAINELIEEGIIKKDDFNKDFVVTKLGEDVLKKL